MKKIICFDMDGTIVDLYGVPGWLEHLRAESPAPYAQAKPMWDMEELGMILSMLQMAGWEVRVITWLAKDASDYYKDITRLIKYEWLRYHGFPFDHFHCVQYGATKADSIRREKPDVAILFDDNEKVRNGWHLGPTVDPTTTNIIEYLEGLL